jgi:4-phosphopantoate--beta-alanine ligase
MRIPKSHPRYKSLKIREELIEHWEEGLVATQGLLAHGRGEAFDYLIGERTIEQARKASKVSAALLLLAKNPVISVNGNTAALVAKDLVKLSRLINAKLEVNLFHRTEHRVKKIAELLRNYGAEKVLGEKTNAKIQGLEHARALCAKEGIFSADVVLVALEDGDRTEALAKIGKKIIAIDLNPLSRTAKSANVTIIDNVIRAIKEITNQVQKLKFLDRNELEKAVASFNNSKNLKSVLKYLSERLKVIERC